MGYTDHWAQPTRARTNLERTELPLTYYEPKKRWPKEKIYKQDRVHDISVIKDLLNSMSTADPPFIDPVSAQNYQAIYEGHFKDLHQSSATEKTPKTRINWIGKWAEYKVFYDLLRASELISSPFLKLTKSKPKPNAWFAARCLFHKKYKDNKAVGNALKDIDDYSVSGPRFVAMYKRFRSIATEYHGNTRELEVLSNQFFEK
jgi:hypothetical protein